MFHNLLSPHTGWQEDFFPPPAGSYSAGLLRCTYRIRRSLLLASFILLLFDQWMRLIIVNAHRLLVCCLGRIRRDHVNYPVRMHADNGSARMFLLQVQVHAWYIVCDCTAVWFGGSLCRAARLRGRTDGVFSSIPHHVFSLQPPPPQKKACA